MSYGSTIKRVRRLRHLSQQALAEGAGISASHLSLIESGGRMPSLEVFQQLSEVLEVPLYLMVFLSAEPEVLDKEIEGLAEIPEQLLGLLLDVE
ncbi:MAG: helix-turn-helix transcriptional regulator [Acidobacteriota bacterium]|nr:helix-turn-helix transcriptional regulator [Acidobacteriota bacterium]